MKIKIEKKYIKFPTNAYAVSKKLCFYNKDNKLVLDLDCKLDYSAPTYIAYVDMSRFLGMELEYNTIPQMECILQQSDEREYDNLYSEEFRPFVHFTPKSGWHNDPNGLIKYKGTYHLFFQYNPCGKEWGNMHWGHAVSKDLLHWEEKDIVLAPDEMGTMYSGSAIEDIHNVTGLKKGDDNPIILFYTAAGDKSLLSKNKLRTQCLAYSIDGGDSFIKYENNPVINHIESYNRDPKVVFVPELDKYLMILYIADDRYGLLTSDNLLHWEILQEVKLINDSECPDIYKFVIGNTNYWAIIGASDKYIIGVFEKGRFVQKTTEKRLSYSEFSYAGQSFSGMDDGRNIRIVWDKLNMPSCAVPHQMGFPTEIKLVRNNNDFYLSSYPVEEIRKLYCESTTKKNFIVNEAGVKFDLKRAAYDISFEADFKNNLTVNIFGLELFFSTAENSIVWKKCRIPISMDLESIRFRMIVDRCSVEIFTDNGKFCATIPFICDYNISNLTLTSEGETSFKSVCCNQLKDIH